MCGIFGTFNMDIEDRIANRCVDLLEHRGPDGRGLYRNENIVFGHRRLSILDLSESGKQPMVYNNGEYVITYNGEVYNFVEIKKELLSLGYFFESETDTEVILKAYIQWGSECLKKFNGMWAFAIWDKRKEKIFISRDRFGIKPLFYTLSDSGFCFASEMKALIPLMNTVTPNRVLIGDYSKILSYEATEECLINEIKRFPAGCFGWIDKNGIKIEKWWETLDNLIDVPETYEEQVEMFRELFFDACKIRMRSDVTIGTALSGGLDSSSTISAMSYISKNNRDSRICEDWQHAYVAMFPGSSLDETKYAKRVIDYLDIDSSYIDINPLKGWKNLDKYVYQFEEFHLTSPVPMMMLYNSVRQGNTVVSIDGHGADELFGGYTFDILEAYKDAKSKAERRTIEETFNGANDNGIKLGGFLRRGSYSDYYLKNLILNIMHGKQTCVGNEKEQGLDALNQRLYNETHRMILPTLLRNYDRYSMSSGVEIRMPFMDYRIVQFAFSIGWKSKIRNGYTKSIIRDAMSSYMPEDIAYRKSKVGFNTPIHEWMKGELRDFFIDTVSSGDFYNCDLIDSKECRKRVECILKSKNPSFSEGEQIWIRMYPYFWEKAFLKKMLGFKSM